MRVKSNFTILYNISCILLILLSGCASFQLPSGAPNPNTIFKYDLKGTVNGLPFDGTGVIPYAPSYTIRITSRVDVDLFTVASCHRDFSVESAINLGWFQKKRGYEYEYTPSQGIENGSCLVRIGAYNKDKGANAWAIIDFQSPNEAMPALNLCNGAQLQEGGVSICQSRVGLIQRLVFTNKVQHSSLIDPKCDFKSADGLTWEYQMPQGECVIAFKEIGGSRIHRHTTIGYNDILIRGE